MVKTSLNNKKTKQSLDESEARFAGAFQHAAIGMALVSPEGHWLKVNASICDIVGYSESELLSLTFQDITHPDDLGTDLRYIKQLLAGEIDHYDLEKRYIHKQGHEVWILLSVSLLHKDDGQPLYFISQIQDINKRKQAESALQKFNTDLEKLVAERTNQLENAYLKLKTSEAQYQDLYDNAPDMYLSVDVRTSKVLHCNKTLCNILGLSKDELLNRSIFELYHPDCHPQVKKTFQAFVDTGEVKDAQLVVQRQDGSKLDVSLNVRAVRDQNGTILHSRSSWRDITERKQLETQLQEVNVELERRVEQRTQDLHAANQRLEQEMSERQQIDLARQKSEERLQLALEGSGDGIWDWDIATGALYLSPQWLAMLEYDVGDLPLQVSTWEKLVHPEDQPWVMKLLNDHLQDPLQPYAFDYRVKTKSGHWKWIGNFGKLVAKDLEGTPLRMAGMHKDITVRKYREEQIKTSLREKEVMLQEIHHRVKNNLQVISSLLNLQARNVNDPGTLEVIKESQNRVSSMALVHEKLYQSKNLDKINFSEYITDLVNSLTRSYQSQSNQVKIKIDVEHVAFKLDIAIPCGLIINELVSNALKYAFTDSLKPEIKISMHTSVEHEINLVIADNGTGIPENFDWRQSRSLGLRLVSNLTRQLSGNIDLLDHEGTVFNLTFPITA
ncbi:PAS domain S-box protein (plasmid) [Acaryochloris sp. 'Moss Beach']|uniref:PAS domain S-box protein n=1 Tax=Acaryochloris sp. 'Moss Beach' TaxID=2740837 RepID=UPI001F243AEE|nr:PAS domain S-box protein [Acaryochloris sp. 'Moss Beach']UJB72401.1 PAS domain S-box protein [Acaryochloris sp. 'Moss Beach']